MNLRFDKEVSARSLVMGGRGKLFSLMLDGWEPENDCRLVVKGH